MTDPISDMLTQIRNAQMVSKSEIRIPFSKLKRELGKLMVAEGYLEKVQKLPNKETGHDVLEVTLKYDANGKGVIDGMKRVSSPGQRIYSNARDIKKVLQGLGISVISTSQGLMPGYKARKAGLGGEIICNIW